VHARAGGDDRDRQRIARLVGDQLLDGPVNGRADPGGPAAGPGAGVGRRRGRSRHVASIAPIAALLMQ
jgi:hypothetical protein